MKHENDIRIAVVGGGIAGLAFALALHKHGLACDWWSLGVFLFELLAGCHKTPFHTGNTQETLKRILTLTLTLTLTPRRP